MLDRVASGMASIAFDLTRYSAEWEYLNLHSEQGGSPEPQQASLDDVQLNVSLELGTASISIHELQALQPGFVFTSGPGFEDSVIARVNGVVIGRGELVRVGDSLGVRLTRVNDHAS
jgi:type III secretion protein Q